MHAVVVGVFSLPSEDTAHVTCFWLIHQRVANEHTRKSRAHKIGDQRCCLCNLVRSFLYEPKCKKVNLLECNTQGTPQDSQCGEMELSLCPPLNLDTVVPMGNKKEYLLGQEVSRVFHKPTRQPHLQYK
mmetsp:Transcript_32027/g.73594  ORF Transcript_32027/g.73594 Transcript_32027/m.73594 type:complete len:129 (-) Transcript_32027:506-892(-)